MKTANVLLILAFAGGLFTASIAPSIAADGRPAAAVATSWLPMSKLVERLEADGYRNIEEIEREDGRYEVRATDRQGTRVKLYLHPQSGEVLDRRQERRWRDGGDSHPRDGTPDCSKRRCRDDAPAGTPPVPAPAR